MDEELKRYLDILNEKLDKILSILQGEEDKDVALESDVEEIEKELLDEMEAKGWEFIYKSYLVKKLQERGLTFDDFIRYCKSFYEKEKDKLYPIK